MATFAELAHSPVERELRFLGEGAEWTARVRFAARSRANPDCSSPPSAARFALADLLG